MSIDFRVKSVAMELSNVIVSLETPQQVDLITSKVQAVLAEAKPFSEDPSIKKLLLQLEDSLNSHDLKELGEKVHGITLPHLGGAAMIDPWEKTKTTVGNKEILSLVALDKAINAFKDNAYFKGRTALLALQGLQNCDSSPEMRIKILELKTLVQKSEEEYKPNHLPEKMGKLFSVVMNSAARIFHPKDWHSSEFRILELLKKTPEKFGLTPDQIFETAKMIIEEFPEKVDFLVNNLSQFGMKPELRIQKNDKKILWYDSKCKIAELVSNKDHGRLKLLVENSATLNVPWFTPEWLLNNVEEVGLSRKQRLEVLKQLFEKYPKALDDEKIKGICYVTICEYQGTHCSRGRQIKKPDFTSDQFLEMAKTVDGSLARDAELFNLTQEQSIQLIMIDLSRHPATTSESHLDLVFWQEKKGSLVFNPSSVF